LSAGGKNGLAAPKTGKTKESPINMIAASVRSRLQAQVGVSISGSASILGSVYSGQFDQILCWKGELANANKHGKHKVSGLRWNFGFRRSTDV
jgi:hypothetical protein